MAIWNVQMTFGELASSVLLIRICPFQTWTLHILYFFAALNVPQCILPILFLSMTREVRCPILLIIIVID